MKIKLFVAREIQYFELGIFSFKSYVYYLTRGFITSTHAFSLPTHAFSVLTLGFELVTRKFELLTRRFELVTRGLELVTRGFKLTLHRFKLVTRNSCFTFPQRNILSTWTKELYAVMACQNLFKQEDLSSYILQNLT